MSIVKGFFKDTVIYGLASVLPRLINFALVPIYTGVFNTSDFSFQTKWYIYAAFINVLLTLGLETSFFRFYTSEGEKNKVISTSFILLLIVSILFMVLGWMFSGTLVVFFGFKEQLLLKILIVVTFLDTLAVIPFALLRVTGRSIKFMAIKIANVIFLVLTTVFLLIIIPYLISIHSTWPEYLGFSQDFKPEVIYIFIANIIASSMTFICLLPEMIKIKWSIEPVLIKKLLSYGLPIMVGGLAYTINENVDKLIIPKLISEDANGIYAACYKLGVFMTLYITAFRMGAEPFFFNHANTSNATEKYSKIMTWFVIFGCLFMVTIIGFIDPIASIFLRQKVYLSGLSIVPVILLANLFSGIYINLSIWYKLTDKTFYGMYISIIGAVITVISILFFVPILGINGGAAATLFTYLSMVLISGYLGNRHYPVPYEIFKITLFIILTLILCAVSYFFLRGSYLPNILIILLFCLVIFISEKEDISNLFKV